MELTAHSINRGIERGVKPSMIKKRVRQFWNELRYSFHTKSFYVLDNQEKFLYVIADKKVITLHSVNWQLLYNKSMKVPRLLRIKLKKYFFEDIELDIHLFRELHKLGITL